MSKELVQIFTEEINYSYPDLKHLRQWIGRCIADEGKEVGPINIIYCTDAYLLTFNQKYLDHDYYTDIITFQYEQDPVEGDLYISLERVTENADNLDIQQQEEVDRVVIHGILHLLGYKDKTEKDQLLMKQKEDHYLHLRAELT